MPMTVGRLIDIARSWHPLFASMSADGMLVSAIDARQRSLVLRYGSAIEGLVSSSVELAVAIDGEVIGVDEDGVPNYSSTVQDGWPVLIAGGVPYIDTTTTPINTDPFGENGGTPGFPLPRDFVKVVHAVAVYTQGQLVELTVVPESARLTKLKTSGPVAFLSGNRLVPARALSSGNTGDVWASSIASIQLSYVALPVLEALDDEILLPATLTEALIAFAAAMLASHAPRMSATDRQRFLEQADRAEELLGEDSASVVGDASTTSVHFKG